MDDLCFEVENECVLLSSNQDIMIKKNVLMVTRKRGKGKHSLHRIINTLGHGAGKVVSVDGKPPYLICPLTILLNTISGRCFAAPSTKL